MVSDGLRWFGADFAAMLQMHKVSKTRRRMPSSKRRYPHIRSTEPVRSPHCSCRCQAAVCVPFIRTGSIIGSWWSSAGGRWRPMAVLQPPSRHRFAWPAGTNFLGIILRREVRKSARALIPPCPARPHVIAGSQPCSAFGIVSHHSQVAPSWPRQSAAPIAPVRSDFCV